MTSIQFLGAAGTVTGSRYLVSTNSKKIMVDCGLFQGLKTLRLKNWESLAIDPASVDCLILTHAHLDHSGYIPRFVKNGFRGKIYCTPATKDLCKILLLDAAHIAEEEATYLNKHKRSKHQPALPLFTSEEAIKSLELFVTVPFETAVALDGLTRFEFRYAGHILGASSVIFDIENRKIAFTGDVGRPNDPIFFPPKPLPHVDYLITESTYGNRVHKNSDPLNDLQQIILDALKRKGSVIIPTFAVGRAQSLMYYLWKLKIDKLIPDIPMYLNSPMANNINELWVRYHFLHRLTADQSKEICKTVSYVQNVDESRALNEMDGSLIILSASGMLTGGRILHHLKKFGPQEKNTILLTGFQAAGTRGEALERGTSELKIHGDYVPINAHVETLDNMSAHADYREMINWFQKSAIKPKKVFITHGEPSAADEFRRRLSETLGWNCEVPSLDETVILD
jgi:metallo-beta-lactamase family protein